MTVEYSVCSLNSHKMEIIRGLKFYLLLSFLTVWISSARASPPTNATDETGIITNLTLAKAFLEDYNEKGQEVFYNREIAAWNYESNLTTHNQDIMVTKTLEKDLFKQDYAQNASLFDWQHFGDPDLKRQFKKISDIGTSAMQDKGKLKKLSDLVAQMQAIYSKAVVCLTGEECLQLEPGLTELFTKNRTYETLLTAWKSWRDATGKKIRPLFVEFVKLSNEAIQSDGYNDTGEYWRSAYEDEGFRKELEDLYTQIKPLYKNLHIYVRRKLKEKYNSSSFPDSGHIPAHLLGNMWAQTWDNVLDILTPYPDMQSVDVTPQMQEQNYTPIKMFRTAESFFKSLGLIEMPREFWEGSIIKRPSDGRPLTCHASAWDFYNSKDFRIKMCTRVTMEDLITIHHEMGHIQYFLQYKDQPLVYRDGANPGFHEAVGDTLALSAGTPEHLHKIGLLDHVETDPQNRTTINYMMKMALGKIAFLPFGYLIDLYRWDVFSGDTQVSEYNKHWWDLRCKYQGIAPPAWRSEEDFDPGAKFHISANVPYIRYFVSFVIQFQFHKALCEKAGHKGPLHTCDIYNSTAAGTHLSNMLKEGSSKPWPELMRNMTGKAQMNASALMEYFQPLTEWLEKQNLDANDTTGWDESCPSPDEEEKAQMWLAETLEPMAEHVNHQDAVAEWNYNTNLTDYNQNLTIKQSLLATTFFKEVAKNASSFKWKGFRDESTRRQLKSLSTLGVDALNDTTKLKRLKELTSKMESVYSEAQVCLDKDRCFEIEPGLTRLVATSRDYRELLAAWEGWRNASGKPVRDLYTEFVDLSNEAVRVAGYNDTGEEWRSYYETKHFRESLAALFDQIKPLYEQLHAYVRGKLRELYGKENFPANGHIPAHLLGNMWAQQWNNIYDIVRPFKDQPDIDVTPELKRQNFTAIKMFKTAEEFYTSVGLLPMPDIFWKKSMITKPTDGRKVVCHASAWDFGDRHDYRIKMCTDITMEDLIVIHHEMGHIQYYLQYKDQPFAFRTGANPGFHEAVGDTLALSVSTPGHLRKIGLLKQANTSYESEINYLLKMALDKIAFLPFGYLIDLWRWNVFSGETPPSSYNKKWWELRCKYQGLSKPVTRHDDDFDPGAKYHVAANVPYIRYFVSFVIQFQFHKAVCDAAGHTGALHECDIYKSKEAGKKLGDMLQMGASKPWPDAMNRLTGQRSMDAGPLMEYFRPLTEWLQEQNKDENVGWAENCPPIPKSPVKRACHRSVNGSPRIFQPSGLICFIGLMLVSLKLY